MTRDQETPGQDEVFDGWRASWTSRCRPYFATERDPGNPIDWDRTLVELHEPVLILKKPGRKFVEVKGQSEIDRVNAEHPNGSLAVMPILRTPLGKE